MSPAAENVIERLDAARQKWWLFSLLTTLVLASCASFALFSVFMLADAFTKFSRPWLIGLSLAWLLATAVLVAAVARRLLRGQRSMEAAARRVESEFPELGSDLINLVQLSEDRPTPGKVFREAAVHQAAARIGQVSFDRAPAKVSRWRRFAHCMQTPRDLAEAFIVLSMLILAACLCRHWIPNWESAASRLLAPWEFVPSVGSVEILNVTPGNAQVLVGESVEIAAEVAVPKDPEAKPYRATLFVTPENEPESPLPMTVDEKRTRFKLTVPSVLKPFRYRLEIGDSQSKAYAIGVREKPVIEGVELTLRYPAYLGRKSEQLAQKGLDLEAPQYTVAELRLRPSVPIAQGCLEANGETFNGHVEQGGNLLTVSMPLLKNGTYCARLWNDANHTDPNPRQNRIAVVPDLPPVVELLKPDRESTASPGTEVSVTIQAGDDHGLSRLRLEMKIVQPETENAAAEDKTSTSDKRDSPIFAETKIGTVPSAKESESISLVKQWVDFPGDSTTTAVRHHRLQLTPDMAKPGQTVLLRAVAWDKRSISDWGLNLKPQETAGSWHAVKIVSEDAKTSADLEQLDALRGAILKILEKQLKARTLAGGLHPSEHDQAVADIRPMQIEIQKTTLDLVKSIGSSDREERLTIKRVLNGLATGDMVQAVARCDELLKQSTSKDSGVKQADRLAVAGTAASELIASQDRIIAVLRKLLDVAREAQAGVLAEAKKRPGSELPDDTKQKLEELRSKLDKFLEQQKKVIEASENLAKVPVEDFSKKEEELLKGLAAAEDDLSKFMNELKSDLSKLPEQDFANSSMAKELVEIQTELKMAEDALLKKSADIAVPLEQLVYERAEELKTNFEKWLPDSPDREKWSQEESLSDKDKEAPMAELPGELEDLVGDLMEQEDDLFDEMEDISSSAADSLDKGAGWDAADGPISDMSAKGVTGNRLPNKSEIGGRSGEGRQGKSSGEFVGDEAVGKGGRKTPTRLTPDPVVKGQIKDHNKQSGGGATGGGKESGKGGEGLVGPQSRSPGPRDTERLAGRQAALRNKAEGIDARFQVSKFHHEDLEKMIAIMAQVERDVKAGRYQNALRQRNVLAEGLGNVKQYLEGQFEVRRDATSNLPADIQKKILGSMQDPSPAGWEELNRRYFDRLSHPDASTAKDSSEKPAIKPEKKN